MNCKIGDLAMKSGQKLSILADSKSEPSRVFYTDILLPLQGAHSVIGRSIVITDDQAPKQRGNRLGKYILSTSTYIWSSNMANPFHSIRT